LQRLKSDVAVILPSRKGGRLYETSIESLRVVTEMGVRASHVRRYGLSDIVNPEKSKPSEDAAQEADSKQAELLEAFGL